MKLSDRVDALEKSIVAHFAESGEIRADLKWLKKSYWVLIGLISTVLAGIVLAALRVTHG
jgi:hypothetical protein